MKRSRFTEKRIVRFLRELEVSQQTAVVYRRPDTGEGIYYKCKLKFVRMEVPDAKRPEALETENAKPKKLLQKAKVLIGQRQRSLYARHAGTAYQIGNGYLPGAQTRHFRIGF